MALGLTESLVLGYLALNLPPETIGVGTAVKTFSSGFASFVAGWTIAQGDVFLDKKRLPYAAVSDDSDKSTTDGAASPPSLTSNDNVPYHVSILLISLMTTLLALYTPLHTLTYLVSGLAHGIWSNVAVGVDISEVVKGRSDVEKAKSFGLARAVQGGAAAVGFGVALIGQGKGGWLFLLGVVAAGARFGAVLVGRRWRG